MSTFAAAVCSDPVICRVASMPSMPGIRMSISSTSGFSRVAISTASAPVAASPITCKSGAVSMRSRKLPRTRAWSSATSTRIIAQDAEEPAHLAQRVAAGALDRGQGPGRLLRAGVGHVVAHPGLDGDQAQAVRHHVMELAGDPQPFLGGRAAPFGQLGLDPPFGLLTQADGVSALLAHRDPGHPGRGEHHG